MHAALCPALLSAIEGSLIFNVLFIHKTYRFVNMSNLILHINQFTILFVIKIKSFGDNKNIKMYGNSLF